MRTSGTRVIAGLAAVVEDDGAGLGDADGRVRDDGGAGVELRRLRGSSTTASGTEPPRDRRNDDTALREGGFRRSG